jgi:alpha-tubulin suppressor-like RCC1 family protein
VPKGTYDPVQLAIGDMHSCVLNRDGRVDCWGEPRTSMTPPPGLRARFIAASGLFSCAIALDGSVVCWGFKNAPPPDGLKAVHIAVGSNGNFYGFDETTPNPLTRANRHACAVKPDQSVVCWGDATSGETTVPSGLRATEVAVGTAHSCALQLDGAVRCWGIINNTDIRMPSGLRAKHIRSSHKAVCAITADDTAVCWGYDRDGKLSGPNGTKVYVP